MAGPPCWIMVKNPLKSTSSGFASGSSRGDGDSARAGHYERRRGTAGAGLGVGRPVVHSYCLGAILVSAAIALSISALSDASDEPAFALAFCRYAIAGFVSPASTFAAGTYSTTAREGRALAAPSRSATASVRRPACIAATACWL